MDTLSDKAIAVFAFAAYHQLSTGTRISRVVRTDHQGHEADPDAVTELTKKGLAAVDGDYIAFTSDGEAMLERAIAGLRNAIGAA